MKTKILFQASLLLSNGFLAGWYIATTDRVDYKLLMIAFAIVVIVVTFTRISILLDVLEDSSMTNDIVNKIHNVLKDE